jgi:hypothetical protein
VYNIVELLNGEIEMIKVYLEETVEKIKAERERQVAIVKEKVTREKIVPFNQEIDRAREKAIAELQSKLNSAIVAHQEQFAKEKQALIDAGEKKKTENANTVITTEIGVVTIEYDRAISKLNEQIQEIKE